MAKVTRVGSGFATLPFDGIDNVQNTFIHDEFLGLDETEVDLTDAAGVAVNTVTAQWTGSEVAGDSGASIEGIAGVAGHPGIARLSTGATTAADGDIGALLLGNQANNAADDNDIILDGNGIYIAALIRIPDVDAQKVEFGLFGQAAAAVNSSALDLVSFVWDPEDAANVDDELFIAQVNSANTDVEEAFSLSYVQNDWCLLELYATDTDAYFRLTTEDGHETINLTPAAMPLVDLRPGISVEAVGNAEEFVDIDVFHLRYGREEQAANATISWLGQSGA